jgi:hypothetical protein
MQLPNFPAVSGSHPWVDVETILTSRTHPVIALGIQRGTQMIVALAVHDRPDVAAFTVARSVLSGAGNFTPPVTIARDFGVSDQPWSELVLYYGAQFVVSPSHTRNTRLIANLAEALGELPRRVDARIIYQRVAEWAHKKNKDLLDNKNNISRGPKDNSVSRVWR